MAAQRADTSRPGYYFSSLTVLHENDALFYGDRDDNYTSGVKIVATTGHLRAGWLPLLSYRGGHTVQSLMLGQTAYTPYYLIFPYPQTTERPYANFLFVGLGRSSVRPDGKVQIYSELLVGSLGSYIIPAIQTFLHKTFFSGSEVPSGWPTQIGNNGALIVNYNLAYSQALWGHINGKGLTVTANAEANVGLLMNYLKLGPGLDWQSSRAGRRANYFISLQPRIRLVAYNTTLQGTLIGNRDYYTQPASAIRRAVFEYAVRMGVVWQRYSLVYNVSEIGQEFTTGKVWHPWGGIELSHSFGANQLPVSSAVERHLIY